MKTYLYDSGFNLLSAQDGQPYKLQFTGFKVTNQAPIPFVSNNNVLPGTVVYTGNDVQMRYVPMTVNDVIVECRVEHDQPQMDLGAVQLLVDDTPFCVAIPNSRYTKVTTTPANDAVGALFVLRVHISIPQLHERMSFINLRSNAATFRPAATENDLPMYPWQEQHDQVVIQRHTKTNGMVFVLNAWGDYWGCPLTAELSNNNTFWKIDGGVLGDDHKYTGN